MRLFSLFCTVFAVFGVADALIWFVFGNTGYGQLFSLVELFWLTLSLFALAYGWQQKQGLVIPAVVFVGYQLVIWGIGSLLATEAHELGADFVPPEWMLLAALIFYGAYFILCRHHYSMEK